MPFTASKSNSASKPDSPKADRLFTFGSNSFSLRRFFKRNFFKRSIRYYRLGNYLHRNRRRVVLTGIGVVSPVGIGKEKFFQSLLAGKTGVDRISQFDPSSFPSQIAAEVNDFEPQRYLTERQIKSYSRASQFACAATTMAIEDSNLQNFDPYSMDVVLGCAISSFNEVDKAVANHPFSGLTYSREHTDPLSSMKVVIHSPACAIALMCGAKGYVSVLSSGCNSALNAIGMAAMRLRYGEARVAISGGVDTPISRLILSGLNRTRMLQTSNNENPKEALCPFDLRHTQSVIGEGAAIFVLEDLEHALTRQAPIYAEVLGFSQAAENINELYFLDHSGDQWVKVVQAALQRSRLKKVDHINAHGPSDKFIDRTETICLKKALGKSAHQIPITSIKGAVGSGFTSAIALQVAAAAISLDRGILPPIYNYHLPDPECDLDFISHPLKRKVATALINTHSLGGINASLVLKSFP